MCYSTLLVLGFAISTFGYKSELINIHFVTDNRLKEIESITSDVLNKIVNENHELSYSLAPILRNGRDGSDEIGKIICNEIIYILDQVGLINSSYYSNNRKGKLKKPNVKSFQPIDVTPLFESPNSLNKIKDEFFSFVYLIPFTYELRSSLNNHYRKTNYIKKGYSKSNLNLPIVLKSNDEFKIFSIANRLSEFLIALVECIEMNKSKSYNNFNIKKELGNILKYSPDKTKRVVINRMKQHVPKNPIKSKYKSDVPSEFEATLCQVLSTDMSKQFKLCLNEIKRIKVCTEEKLQKLPNENPIVWQSFDRIVKDIFNYDIKHLNNLMKKNHTKRFTAEWLFWDLNKYVTLFYNTYSPTNKTKDMKLKSSVKRLQNDILQSEIGSDLLKEVNILKRIYDEGVDKKKRLMSMGKTNENALRNYRKVSKSLSDFKDILTRILFAIISQINIIATTIEKFLSTISFASNKLTLKNNVNSLKCLQKLIDKVRHLLDKDAKLNESTTVDPLYDEFWNFGDYEFDYHNESIDGLILPDDYLLNDFVRSIKHLAKSPVMKQPSTIVMLANTFLLATIFYECIAMLAGVMYPSDTNQMTFSSANTDNMPHDLYSYDISDDINSPGEESNDYGTFSAGDDDVDHSGDDDDEDDDYDFELRKSKKKKLKPSPREEQSSESINLK